MMVRAVLLMMIGLQGPLPQQLNVRAGTTSIEFYEGLEGPLYRQGLGLFESGEYGQALVRFEELYEAASHPAALFLAGNALYQLGELDRAIDVYLRVIDEGLDRMPDVHYNLANAYYGKYRRREAIESFRRVLELTEGRDAMAHYHLGILLDGEGAHEESIAHYLRTVELTEDGEPLARQHLGVAYFMNGQYEESVEELEIYVGQVPDDAGGYLNLGIALRYAGRMDEALEQFDESLNVSGNRLAPAHYELGRIHAERGDYRRAIEHFEAAIAGGHTSPKIEQEYEAVKRKAGG